MSLGTFYGIGVGPGDPELMTVKGMRILAGCKRVFTPKARIKAESIAQLIAGEYIRIDAEVREFVFPMVEDREVLASHWKECATEIHAVLKTGEDACFLTLGDTLLYSTYIYLIRELKKIEPALKIVTVPGVNAFSATAAATNFPLGESRSTITIAPSSDDMERLERALDGDGTIVIMKVGKRLQEILALLRSKELLDSSVFVARAGLEGERIVTNMRELEGADPKTGYLSIILVDAERKWKA